MDGDNDVTFCSEHVKLAKDVACMGVKIDFIHAYIKKKDEQEQKDKDDKKSEKNFNITTLLSVLAVLIALAALLMG
jgi:uncharacterized protein YqhQ